MRSLIMDGPRKSHVEDIPIPEITDDQLLVKLLYTGACHSEFYPWATAVKGTRFGHEPMGIVAKVGRNVKGFKEGDRVAGLGRGFCEYIAMEPAYAVHVPDNVTNEDAGALQALGCIVSAISKVPVATPGDTVAVVGTGYMGLGAISLLKAFGAGRIIAVDIREEARENAKKFGADEVYAPEDLPKEYLLSAETWKNYDLSPGDKGVDIFRTGFDRVIEFTGTPSGLQLAGDMVCAHGTLAIGGFHTDGMRTVDMRLWNMKGMTAISTHERRSDYLAKCCQNAITMLSSGQWNFKNIHKIYQMDEFDLVNSHMETKPAGFIKGLIKCD